MELHIPTQLAIFSISIILLTRFSSSSSYSCLSWSSLSNLHPLVVDSALEHLNYTAVSEFRLLNRRRILQCRDPNPYLQINVGGDTALGDEEYLTVNVTGVLVPADSDWVAMISPSNADVSDCPLNKALYAETGDLSDLPLLCHYPVKAQYLSKDPDYLSCKKKECKKYKDGQCVVTTCGGTLTFHVVNIRTDIEFVLFAGGFATPCVLKKSNSLTFANPNQPLYGHLSSIDSTGTSMRITWVSGDKEPQEVQYGDGKSRTSEVSTFSQDDMCTGKVLHSPAKDFGWHDPGYIHSAVMTGLQPSTSYPYKYGR